LARFSTALVLASVLALALRAWFRLSCSAIG
jgi:hypothetical protein